MDGGGAPVVPGTPLRSRVPTSRGSDSTVAWKRQKAFMDATGVPERNSLFSLVSICMCKE